MKPRVEKLAGKETEKGYWYFTWYYECPVCGRGSEERERRPLPKPVNPEDRSEFTERYCGCMRIDY